MITFIDTIIEQIDQQFGTDYRKVCVIFPTRRACLIFRKRLAEKQEKPVFAPGILGIGDFVNKHSSLQIADEIPLLLALYDVYKKHWPDQDFGKFYPWGQMLINDFDEIDKQLSETTRIFTNISELRKIEAAFLPDADSMKWINEFLSAFNTNKLTTLQEEFAKNWNRLSQIYSEFNKNLDSKGLAYEGKAYRDLLKKLKSNEFESKWDHFIFAGFYGFSRAEEDMIRLLSEKKKAHVFWDSDHYYIDNLSHEAGYYFRKSSLFKGYPNGIGNHFSGVEKRIEITGVPLKAGQAKYTGELLQLLTSSGQLDINKAAIILPDENMLFPVLYSLPPEIDPVNVTMGYPLKQSQYSELISILHDAHKFSKTTTNNTILFYHRHVTRILKHPLLTGFTGDTFIQGNSEPFNYMDSEKIASLYGFTLVNEVFVSIKSGAGLFEYIVSLLSKIQEGRDHTKEKTAHFEDTIIGFIISEISELIQQLEGYLELIPVATAWQLLVECVSGLKIPFTGEPVKGLQIMGFLETRGLDFETIIILNANEGILPATGGNRSFIPYSLRKGFGLPTFEDADASFSYHFYRLLHKAKNIYLLYNSEVNKTGGGEPSRFILQIKHELQRVMGDHLKLSFSTINTSIDAGIIEPITIKKSEDVYIELNKFLISDTSEFPKKFSSSALTTYLNCSLQYYFRYIAHLREAEESSDKIEADIFGTIFHGALEKLYSGLELVTTDEINQLLLKSDSEVEAAIKREYGISYLQLEGEDILMAEVIKELVKKILLQDKNEAPFTIEKLEGEFNATLHRKDKTEVRLFGKFDRVDEREGIIRIIDYKTGKVELKSKDIEELFSNPKKKTLFQLLFYALLYNKNFPSRIIKTGFYVAKSLGSGILFPGNGLPVEQATIDAFSERLSLLLDEIYDSSIPFSQTEDVKRCEYCPYKNICQR
ncbi:MAG: PD-(D/E)XK nuclease family protein [Bacteroidetes bacterium]|nr:PD-(D/E)XK nuclease family protein [Bacteroidota bacterium]